MLNSCRRAKGAEFRHGDRQGCLKGTRNAVLDGIESWSKDSNTSPLYWLNGLAGTGKSTIAQTTAERVFADGRLGASFFCSRDFKDRRNLHYIFPTLAFQLAHNYPQFRSILVPLLRANPDIGHESLFNQMRVLIVEPLSSSDVSTVIIIDALDECADEDPQSAILSVMGRLVERIPGVKFLITGRPEPRIKSGFRLGLLRPLTGVFVLHEVEPSVINADIRLFLEHGLSELAKRRGIERDAWPTDEDLDLLCERAAGLFVYAVATLKFLDHAFTPPSKRLDIIARAPGNTAHEGKAKVRPSVTLDSLYLSSFQNAFDGMDAEDDENVRFVIGTVVLAVNPLPPSAIATLVGLGKGQVMDLLRLAQSFLKLHEDPDSPVLPFHKSFPDFITDPTRCTSKRFHISPRTGHLKLVLSCLKLMNDNLERNPLSLPDYVLNLEVEDLGVRVEGRISTALQYACKSWHNHLTEVSGDIAGIVPALRSFLQERFLAWLEVLSVIGAARDAVVALEKLMPWLREVRFRSPPRCLMILTCDIIQAAMEHRLLDTARDYFQFVTNFLEVIDVSATHIYHSALELSPLSSNVRKLYYHQRSHPSPRVVIGIPDSWDPSTAVSSKHSYYLSSTWSPCGQFVAAVAGAAVEIRDALTLEPLFTLQSTKVAARFRRGLAYSPDGHSLAGCSNTAIIIWDTQTGGEVRAIECEVTGDGLELVWSLDGKTIGTISPRVSGTHTVRTYEVASGVMRSSSTVQSAGGTHIWAHGKSFRVVTTAEDRKDRKISVFDVGSSLDETEPFHFRSHFDFEVFSPTTYRISASVAGSRDRDSELLIFDLRDSKVLLRETGHYLDLTFSPDGSLFAAFAGERLHIWRYDSGQYTRWREFRQAPMVVQFSPTLSSILGDAGVLHVLHLGYSPTSLATESVATTPSRLQDAISPGSTYIATAHCGESTVTITDLQAQDPSPSQFIDTDLEISAIVLTGNVLLVKGSDTVVAWLLTEKGVVDGIFGNTRADRNDSLWEVSQWDSDRQGTSSRDKNPGFWSRLLQQERGNRNENGDLGFSVGDGIAVIRRHNGHVIRVYRTGTGEILKSVEAPLRTWYRFNHPLRDECDLYHHDLRKHHDPVECDWPVSQTTLQGGWVKDPEGKHRLWLHARWRSSENDVEWLHNVTTLRLKTPSELVIVKF